MCLAVVDKVTKKGKGYGYKAFKKKRGSLTPVMGYSLDFPEEEWFTDPNTQPITNLYPAGFHIHTNKKHAGWWNGDAVRKVYYREAVASGLFSEQPPQRVIIARQIWITKEEI